jgi:hypothetical protein
LDKAARAKESAMTIVLETIDINHTSTIGIDAAAATTYMVEQNVHVSSDVQGFRTIQANSGLINAGGVFSSGQAAALLAGDNGTLLNQPGATIDGATGIVLAALNVSVTNLGTVAGLADYGFDMSSGYGAIDNEGYLSGVTAGIYEQSPSSTATTIANSGKIVSPQWGIHLDTDPGVSTAIDNTGTISGGSRGIVAQGGAFTLTNAGTIIGGVDAEGTAATVDNSGTIYGGIGTGSGALTIVNHGTISSTGNVFGEAIGDGHGAVSLQNFGKIVGDIFCAAALAGITMDNAGSISGRITLGSADDTYLGSTGTATEIDGWTGNDRIVGGPSGERIDGGRGIDTLAGGGGADTFVFDDAADSAAGANRDVITDFHHTQHDLIDLSGIDANTALANDQAFHFIGKQTFAHYHHTHPGVAGLVRFAGGVLHGEVGGHPVVDFDIQLTGVTHLYAADLIL